MNEETLAHWGGGAVGPKIKLKKKIMLEVKCLYFCVIPLVSQVPWFFFLSAGIFKVYVGLILGFLLS